MYACSLGDAIIMIVLVCLFPAENCTADLLLRGNDIGIGSCGAGNSASVSYTTLTPGSTATYTSCPGYEGGDVTLTCLPNGNWDGTPPDYNETPPTCGCKSAQSLHMHCTVTYILLKIRVRTLFWNSMLWLKLNCCRML